MPDDAARIVRFWQAVEKFSPQSLKDPDPRKNLVDVRPGEPMPWEPGSSLSQQPVKPGKVWRHRIYGGVYELSRVRDVLVKLFGDDQMEERQLEPVRGESALFACTIDEDGFLVAESAVLSMCPSAIGRAAASRGAVAAWLDGFAADVLSYEDELGKLAGSRLDAGVRWLAASIRAAVPGAVGDGVKVAVTGALAPVAGHLAAAGGRLPGLRS